MKILSNISSTSTLPTILPKYLVANLKSSAAFSKSCDKSLSIKLSNSLLSTGGSAVYSSDAMHYLKQNSLVIYLEVPFDQILQRVPSFLDRGFAKEPNQSIESAFQERQELYKKSAHHIILNTDDLNSCVTKILSLI